MTFSEGVKQKPPYLMHDQIRAMYNLRIITGYAPIHVVQMHLITAMGLMHLMITF
jgi:hypothetical protein